MKNRLWILPVLLLVGGMLLAGCVQMNEIKGEMKLSQGNYEEAIPLFEEFLAAKPDSTRVRGRLGFALLKTGRLDEAIAALKKVLAAEPGEPYAVLNLGLAYLNKEDIGAAIKTWHGYRNKERPLVEEEIKRQLTLLQIAQSQRLAKKALAQESQLGGAKADDDTIAVTYFQDLSPDKTLRAFQKGLAAMIISDLAKIKSVRVVERLRLQALLEEMKLGQTGIVDPQTAPRVGRLLGAGKLVVGSLAQGSLQVTTSLSSTGRGIVMGTSQLTVPTDKFYDISSGVVRSIAQMAGVSLSAAEEQAIGVPQTTNLKAFTLFGQALDALDAGNWAMAKDLYAQALQEDPNFGLAAEGHQGCPSGGSPSKAALGGMAPAQIADVAETGLERAETEQATADQAAADASSASGGDCFAYDTLVLMADQSHKRIIELKKGDMVQTRNVKSGLIVNRPVIKTFYADQDHYYLINDRIQITENHPVYIDPGKWVKTSELRVGDRIGGLDGSIEIESIRRIAYDQRVYNFEVADSHNYFVSAYGKEHFLVHNSKH